MFSEAKTEVKRATVGFALSLISGVLVLLNGILLIVIATRLQDFLNSIVNLTLELTRFRLSSYVLGLYMVKECVSTQALHKSAHRPVAPKKLYGINLRQIRELVLKGKYSPAVFLFLLLIPLAPSARRSVGSEVHDIVVTSVTSWPNLTLPSYVRVNVTVENQGTSHETFNVTVHADNLTVTSATVTDMAPGSDETLKLRCDLFPFREVIFPRPLWSTPQPMTANVTVWAEASVVAGEVNTTNNVRVGGSVSIIWWFTDLNGDGRINIIDIAIMAKKLGGGGFHPLLDFNEDGLINLLDIACLARSYGRVYYEPSNLDDP